MNSSKLVTDSLLGLDFRYVIVAGEPFRINPPTIETLCRAINHLGLIEQHTTLVEFIEQIEHFREHAANGIACFIVPQDGEEYNRVVQQLNHATIGELKEALATAINLLSLSDFFAFAALAQNVASMAAKS